MIHYMLRVCYMVYVDCFNFMAVVNNPATNMGHQVYMGTCVYKYLFESLLSLLFLPRVELLDHVVILLLIF